MTPLRVCSFLFLVSSVLTNDFTRHESIRPRRFLWDRIAPAPDTGLPEHQSSDCIATKRRNQTPLTTIASIHRDVARATASAISTLGFITSVTMGLLSSRANFGSLRPPIEAMQLYLEDTGISKELGKSFTTRLFDNVVILWRMQRQYRATHDLRDTVALKRNRESIPTMEEASR